MKYLHWNQETITDFSDKYVSEMYEKGYVFTRLGKGVMHQTRSVRIDLNLFALNSENRRILKKTDGLNARAEELPLADYSFKLGKIAKDFYEAKFGKGVMSAQKIKEMLTDSMKSNFNQLLIFVPNAPARQSQSPEEPASEGEPAESKGCGFAICYENESLLHYSYPFYDLNAAPRDMGLGMMIRAVEWAKSCNKKYIYLGSLQRPADTYKLQFEGLEWFDGQRWSNNLDIVKEILGKSSGEAV
jgi:arginyl-tRNA--protein-N-Asp/Glu arginylyltransferase